jgi:hypothetical protein
MTRQRFVDWCFRNRQTGEITVGQPPNPPVVICVVALGSRWLFHPPGMISTALGVIGTGAGVFWAGDELLRGVNPWRRMIGATVLGGIVIVLVRR